MLSRRVDATDDIGWKVTFQVDPHWKGFASRQIVATSPQGVCGIGFTVGSIYFVAAAAGNQGLIVGICRPEWFHSRDPNAFVATLGEGSLPPAP